MGKKKVLLVTRVSGFIPQFEMNNVKILQEMGYEVHYAANFHTIVYGKDNSRLEGTGVILHQIDFNRSPFSPAVRVSYRQLKHLLMEEKFDLIHCHMPMSAVVTRIAAQSVRRKSGRQTPVLYTAHGFHFYEGAPLKNWLYYPVERILARYTDRLILINDEDYARAQKFPVRGIVEHTMGIGMKLEKFADYEKQQWEECEPVQSGIILREKLQISSQDRIMMSVGELTKRKNNITMIEAMTELKDVPVVYVICGTGPMEQKLRVRVQELGLERRVFFAGYVTEVPALLKQADCFVFPSFQEGLPVAVMEAMAVGLPVIASRIRGITDLIEHTQGGYLVQGHDPVDYAVKVRRMFTERESKSSMPRGQRRELMGRWNRQQIQKFALPVVEKKMREIYQSIEKEGAAGTEME